MVNPSPTKPPTACGWYATPPRAVVSHNLGESEIGVKFDDDKIRMDLIPPELFQAVGEVLTAGAAKYGPRNWEKGLKYSRCIGAILRHLVSFMSGEVMDPESGLPHIDCVIVNAMFISTSMRRGMDEFNDLPWRRNHNGKI